MYVLTTHYLMKIELSLSLSLSLYPSIHQSIYLSISLSLSLIIHLPSLSYGNFSYYNYIPLFIIVCIHFIGLNIDPYVMNTLTSDNLLHKAELKTNQDVLLRSYC